MYDSPQPTKTKFSKKGIFEEKIDPHKKTFLDQLNKTTRSKNQQIFHSPIISSSNMINSSPVNELNLSNKKQKQNQQSIFALTTNQEKESNNNLNLENENLQSFEKQNEPQGIISNTESKYNKKFSTSNNKIIPNKWDEMEISGKNLEKYIDNKADMLTGLDECETESRKNDMDSNFDLKIDNYFNNNNELNMNADKFNTNKNMDISRIENKLFNKDNYFDNPNIEMDEESLVSQLDKIDFIENSNLKLLRGKSSESNSIPNYFISPERKMSNNRNNSNPVDYNMNENNNNKQIYNMNPLNGQNFNINNNHNNENAIINQIFGNDNLMKNQNLSSMSICPNTSVEEYNNEYIIKNETDLDLIFDMIYKSQKISLDVMFNLRNKLRIRGYNTVLSLRLKREKDKSWNFLFEDYKDISPEIEALALILEYYLEKKTTNRF